MPDLWHSFFAAGIEGRGCQITSGVAGMWSSGIYLTYITSRRYCSYVQCHSEPGTSHPAGRCEFSVGSAALVSVGRLAQRPLATVISPSCAKPCIRIPADT